MDEDEEDNREGGGCEMTERMALCLFMLNTHLQAIDFFSRCVKSAISKSSSIWTGTVIPNPPSSFGFN